MPAEWFFKSIHGTLNHIAIGDPIESGRFIQQPSTANVCDELYRDFNQLRTERERLDRDLGTKFNPSLAR